MTSVARKRAMRNETTKQRKGRRRRLAEAQNWRCCHCGTTLDFDTATIEHIVPCVLGGSNDWLNKAVSCLPCNQSHAPKTLRHP
jgi:5-methylcytosine-specific restriction endonuclease McrA